MHKVNHWLTPEEIRLTHTEFSGGPLHDEGPKTPRGSPPHPS